jgi:ribonuclease HI
MAESSVLTIHTDGASRGNPGDAAFAYVITRDGQLPIEEAGCLGQMTNNQAEYIALVRALERALKLGAQHRVLVHSDSELMVKQMNGEYRVKNEDLRELFEQACALRNRFAGLVTIRHVRRAENKRADELCNLVLDGKGRVKPADFEKDKPTLSLHDEAVACLCEAAVVWSSGANVPTPAQVWRQLVDLLKRHRVTVPPDKH